MRHHGTIRDAEALGPMLAQARYVAGLSQRDLAARLGVSQRYVWQMEAGAPTTLVSRYFEAMKACGMTLTAEFGPHEEPGHAA